MGRKRILCKCGCGEKVKPGNTFLRGHSGRGKSRSEETKRKIGNAHRGKEISSK